MTENLHHQWTKINAVETNLEHATIIYVMLTPPKKMGSFPNVTGNCNIQPLIS